MENKKTICPNCGCDPQAKPYCMEPTHCPICGHIFTEQSGTLKAINIQWDVDNPDDLIGLPKEVRVPDGMMNISEIEDYLADLTGYCHNGFVLERIEVDLDSDEAEARIKAMAKDICMMANSCNSTCTSCCDAYKHARRAVLHGYRKETDTAKDILSEVQRIFWKYSKDDAGFEKAFDALYARYNINAKVKTGSVFEQAEESNGR